VWNERLYHDALLTWEGKAKPKRALGRLEELTANLAAVWGSIDVQEVRPGVVVFAADHGVAEEGISAYPKEVTALMLKAFTSGGACISVFCRSIGAKLWVSDVGVDADTVGIPGVSQDKIRKGSVNFLKGPALGENEVQRALEVGERYAGLLAQAGVNLGIGGEMGIGNTTPSAAIIALLLGLAPECVVGRGSGLDPEGYEKKVGVVTRALNERGPDPKDPVSVLSELGGLEIAALAGFYAGLKKGVSGRPRRGHFLGRVPRSEAYRARARQVRVLWARWQGGGLKGRARAAVCKTHSFARHGAWRGNGRHPCSEPFDARLESVP